MPRTCRAPGVERTVDSGQFHGIVNAITVYVGIFKNQGLYLDTPFTLIERVKTVKMTYSTHAGYPAFCSVREKTSGEIIHGTSR